MNNNRFQDLLAESEKTKDIVLKKIEELGENSVELFNALNDIQDLFDLIRKTPDDLRLKNAYMVQMRAEWKQQVDEIYDKMRKTTSNSNPKFGVVGTSASVFAAAPNIAAGIATTFETVALAMAAPVLGGVTTAGAAVALSITPIFDPVSAIMIGIIMYVKNNEKARMEDLFSLITERNIKNYQGSIVEINERINEIQPSVRLLREGINDIQSFGTDFEMMSEDQQVELGYYYNRVMLATHLLVGPIRGLTPSITEKDIENYASFLEEIAEKEKNEWRNSEKSASGFFKKAKTADVYTYTCLQISWCISRRKVLLALCNLLYKIQFDDKDADLLCKCLKHNGEFLKEFDLEAEEVDWYFMNLVKDILDFKYKIGSYSELLRKMNV